MLRVGMANPPFILEHLREIGAVLRDPRAFASLHVPVRRARRAAAGSGPWRARHGRSALAVLPGAPCTAGTWRARPLVSQS